MTEAIVADPWNRHDSSALPTSHRRAPLPTNAEDDNVRQPASVTSADLPYGTGSALAYEGPSEGLTGTPMFVLAAPHPPPSLCPLAHKSLYPSSPPPWPPFQDHRAQDHQQLTTVPSSQPDSYIMQSDI